MELGFIEAVACSCRSDDDEEPYMTYAILPLTEDPWQVFTLDLAIDGEAFHAQIEIRYLPAPDQWVISIWDHAVGEMLVNQIPLICSYEQLNDLLLPFRHLRGGKGMGSLFCLRNTDQPKTADPAKGNLTEFQVLWGDTWAGSFRFSYL